MRAIARVNMVIVVSLFAVLVSSYPAAAAGDFIITGTGGLTIPTGDIGKDLVGPGIVFGGLPSVPIILRQRLNVNWRAVGGDRDGESGCQAIRC